MTCFWKVSVRPRPPARDSAPRRRWHPCAPPSTVRLVYKVEILPKAVGDMSSAVAYIAGELQSPHAAERLMVGLNAAIEGLADFPYSHPSYIPIRPLRHEYRRVMVGNYGIFYWVDEPAKTVTVSRVIYARRNLSQQLS
nr:type II toxin-antitoxin system RelE/ParE family toxin [Bifidobacterium sp. SO4]